MCIRDRHNADLYKLNFNRRDTVSVVRGNLTAQGSGIGLDELNGTIEIDDMTYINHIDTCLLYTSRCV